MRERKPRKAQTILLNATYLFEDVQFCYQLFDPNLHGWWYKMLDNFKESKHQARYEASRRAGGRAHGVATGFYEILLWTQCVRDEDFERKWVSDPGFEHEVLDHTAHLFEEYDASCWLSRAPPVGCEAPTRTCRLCQFPMDAAYSYHHGVSNWRDVFEIGHTTFPEDAGLISHRALNQLRGYIHSTHNRGPFHWVPFLENFDWLLLGWDPSTYRTFDRMLRKCTLLKNFPASKRAPFVGGYLVRRVEKPASLFMPVSMLPYFMRYVLPLLPMEGVALYVGRGWYDGVVPDAWVDAVASHPAVAHLFIENPQQKHHPSVTAMPIGMDPMFMQGESGRELLRIANSVPLSEKLIDRAAGGWGPRGPVRQAAFNYIASVPWCDWVNTADFGEYGTRQMEYWRIVAQYGFIFSPPAVYRGMGSMGPNADTDSYRTTEALVLRSIPILWEGPNAWAWEGLPVVRVRSWEEVTPENMRRWWNERKHMLEGDQPYLRSVHWWAKIERVVNASRSRRPP